MKNNILKINLSKYPWLKATLLAVIFIGLIILLSQLLIFSRPQPLRFYLEFLDKKSERGQSVSIYSKKEFAQKYFGLNDQNYQANNFSKLFQEYFNYPPAKENSLFQIYKIADKENPCQVNIYGVSKRKDLVYTSFENICLKNAQKNK